MTKEQAFQKLIGTWSLVSTHAIRMKDGKLINYYGTKPSGVLTYDKSGHVQAQIMDGTRKPWTSDDLDEATNEEIKKAFQTYQCYYAKFDYDEKEKAVVHHVKGALNPNWHSKKKLAKQVRYLHFEGEHILHLSTPEIKAKGEKYIFFIQWKKDTHEQVKTMAKKKKIN